jgi:molybdopterin synthase catalytic subunit
MKRELSITTESIDEPALAARRSASSGMGAAVYFTGMVRVTEAGQPIQALDYEVFRTMAERQFHLIFDEAERRWPVESIRLVHRVGRVLVGETSLWIELVAPHRGEAFAACQFVIDEMKRRVPIWKKAVAV